MASLTQWTCIWANSQRQRSTEKSGLQQARTPCFSLFSRVCPCSCPLKSMMLSSYLILCLPLLLLSSIIPNIRVFPTELAFHIRWPKYWSSASASVLPMNIQSWFPLGLTGLVSLLAKGLSGVFSSTTIQKHQFFGTQFSSQSNSHIHTYHWKNIMS